METHKAKNSSYDDDNKKSNVEKNRGHLRSLNGIKKKKTGREWIEIGILMSGRKNQHERKQKRYELSLGLSELSCVKEEREKELKSSSLCRKRKNLD